MKRRLIPLLSAALLSGCASVELTSVGSLDGRDRLLVIQNDGYMLVGAVPLASGALAWNAGKQDVVVTPQLFANNADTRHLYAMAQKIAERENCELVNPTVVDNYLGLEPERVYGLITLDDVTLSAVLRPRK